jgi:hypothetical protein
MIVTLVLIIPFDFFGHKLLYYGAMLMEFAGISVVNTAFSKRGICPRWNDVKFLTWLLILVCIIADSTIMQFDRGDYGEI